MTSHRNHGLNKTCIFNQAEFDDFMYIYVTLGKTFEETVAAKIKKNPNFSVQIIEEALMRKIREFILNWIEDDLYSAEKIERLIMYDHDSEILFRPMIRILDIIKPESSRSMMQCFKAMKIQGYFHSSERNFHSVPSQQKMIIYQSIVDYAKQHELFEKVRSLKKDPSQDRPPYLDLDKIFNPRDQEFIYHLFQNCNFDVTVLIEQLKNYNLHRKNEQFYTDEELTDKIENFLMIGLYEIFKLIVQIEKIRLTRWHIFSERKILNEDFQPYFYLLARVAIRKDPKPFQTRKVGYLLGRRVITRTERKQQLRFCALYRYIKKHIVMKRIENQMRKVFQIEGPQKYIIPSSNSQEDTEEINSDWFSKEGKSWSRCKTKKYDQDSFRTPLSSKDFSDFDQYEGYNSIFENDLSKIIRKKQEKRQRQLQSRKARFANQKAGQKKRKQV